MGWSLPINPNPPDTVCIMARVPNDSAYIEAFWGAILDLGAGFNWADDSAHTAILASRRMRQMYYEMVENNCIPAPNIINPPCCNCCEGCMAVRWNGCVLEEYDCSTQSWITVPTVNGPCITNPAPGGGTTPPIAGNCEVYALQFLANSLTPLPFLVNSGDQITVLQLLGAGSDGTPNWFCGDGSFFIAGACVGGGHTIPGDPLPTANHMSVVVKIGPAYYPLVSGTLTLPTGIVNQQIYIGVNDASLTDDSGQYSIKFNYCNNQAPPVGTWCHREDYTLSPSGATIGSTTSLAECGGTYSGSLGSWVSGSGFEGIHLTQVDCTHDFSDLNVIVDMGTAAAFTAEIKGTLGTDTTSGNQVALLASNDPTFATYDVVINDTSIGSGSFDLTGSDSTPRRYLLLIASARNVAAISGALALFSSLKLTGSGANPFGSNNC